MPAFAWFELGQPDGAAFKVDRARESIDLVAIVPVHHKATNNPIVPSRIVVYRYVLERKLVRTQTLLGLLLNGLLADSNSLIRRHAPAVSRLPSATLGIAA